MAEGIAQSLVEEHPDISFSSMGVQALVGHPADPLAVQACGAIDVDISAHRGKQLAVADLLDADHIFCMEKSHLNFILSLSPLLSQHTSLLTEYPVKHLFKKEVKDPYGHPLKAFVKCRTLIQVSLRDIVKEIVSQ